MRGRRAYVVAVAAWLLVVAVGSTLVWEVISRAGEGVVAGADAARPPTVPGRTPSAPTTPTTSVPSPQPSASPPPASPPPASLSPAPQPPTSQPPTSQLPAPKPPVARRATWQGSVGVVIAECRRSTIRLVGAYPNSGWSMRVEDRGPLQVVIRFEGGDDRGETGLGARCVQGAPAYAVTGEGSGNGSGDG